MHIILCLFFLITATLFSQTPLKITIYTHFNGIGLETDERILREALEKLGHEVQSFNWTDTGDYEADINIHIEQIVPTKINNAKLNWFISNPEWYQQDKKLLNEMDLILCRTQQSMKIFQPLQNTYYLGFTSPDAYRPHIAKDFTLFAHLPGASNFQKGTKEVMYVWKHYPDLPNLTLVDWTGSLVTSRPNLHIIPHKLSLDDYRTIQNQAGIHVCPSYAEGFGHYIMEAMSTGAVVLTTNGTPMNELIRDKRCLINVRNPTPYRLGVRYDVVNTSMREKIVGITKLSPQVLQRIGQANRTEYLRRTKEFHQRLEYLMDNAVRQLSPH